MTRHDPHYWLYVALFALVFLAVVLPVSRWRYRTPYRIVRLSKTSWQYAPVMKWPLATPLFGRRTWVYLNANGYWNFAQTAEAITAGQRAGKTVITTAFQMHAHGTHPMWMTRDQAREVVRMAREVNLQTQTAEPTL